MKCCDKKRRKLFVNDVQKFSIISINVMFVWTNVYLCVIIKVLLLLITKTKNAKSEWYSITDSKTTDRKCDYLSHTHLINFVVTLKFDKCDKPKWHSERERVASGRKREALLKCEEVWFIEESENEFWEIRVYYSCRLSSIALHLLQGSYISTVFIQL